MKSIYIHIPFCNKICSYCDFPKIYYDKKIVSKYLEALENEIKLNYKEEQINTIYIGGGTPSSLSIDELKKLFNIIKPFNKNITEFTFEVNIDSIDEEKLKYLYDNGVNRISIGIETFSKKIGNILDRYTSYEEVKEVIKLMRKIGFNNINGDLIYAVPNETIKDLKEDLDKILSLDLEHISTYSLIIENNTILGINKVSNIDENIDYKMYNIICNKLKEKYLHYEISNFSKSGYESKHNLVYWNNMEYYGFGLGASSYINNTRYENTRSINHYIEGKYIKESNLLSIDETMENEMILGLRKLIGVNKNTFRYKYGMDIEEVFNINIEGLIDDGTYVYIDKDYLYISNEILINFIGGVNG